MMAKKIAIVAVVALVVGAIFYFNLSDEGGLGTAIGFQKEAIPEVTTVKVGLADISATVTAPGIIAAAREISLHSLIQGRVLEILVKSGQPVKQGDLLIRLDDRELASELKLAELDLVQQKAQLEEQRISRDGAVRDVDQKQKELQEEMEAVSDVGKANADLATAKARLDGAREKWERYKNATGASAEERDRARNDYETAQKQYESAEATVRQAQEGKDRKVLQAKAALEKARNAQQASQAGFDKHAEIVKSGEEKVKVRTDALEKALVRSPMDGVVTRVNVSANDMVSPGSMNNPGTVLVTVSDLSSILVTADIDEIDVVGLAKGQSATVTVEALAGVKFRGEVHEIATAADAKKESEIPTFKTRLVVREPAEALPRLRPGLSAHVEIVTQTHPHVVAVPLQSVVRRALARVRRKDEDPGPVDPAEADRMVQVVFVLEGSRAVVRRVAVGITDDTRAEILENNLKTGEVLITGPYRVLDRLKDGDRVTGKEPAR